MFLAIPKYLKAEVADVSSVSSRLQAVIPKTGYRNMLIFNTYFPQDPKTDDFETDDLLISLIGIQNILKENDCTEVIWTDDINADFSRGTKFMNIIGNVVNEQNLVRSWDRFDVDYTHESNVRDTTYTTAIDHFFWNHCLSSNIPIAGVLHLPNNPSDHSPICCVKQNDEILIQKQDINKLERKPSWKRATEDESSDFFTELDRKLKCCNAQNEVINCRNVCCQNANHKAACDDYMLDILQKMEQTARETLTIPNANDAPHKSIPRWNDDIEPYRKDALIWHSAWLSAGRPLHTLLHRMMKRTRNIYHLYILKNKRMLDKIKNNKLLDACINNQNGIFTELKAMRKNTLLTKTGRIYPSTSQTNIKHYKTASMMRKSCKRSKKKYINELDTRKS